MRNTASLNYKPPRLLGHLWEGDSPGARLRQAKITKGMTIYELAAAAGLSTAAIGSLEAGKTAAALLNLRKFCGLLGVSVVYLGRFEALPEENLGQRIKKARLYHGLTQRELARAVGVDKKTLRHWEMDRRVPLERSLVVLQKFLQGMSLRQEQLHKFPEKAGDQLFK